MQSMIKEVFKIIAALVLALLLYALVFGYRGRTFMWGGIKPVIEKSWKAFTYNDGNTLKQSRDNIFNSARDLSTN